MKSGIITYSLYAGPNGAGRSIFGVLNKAKEQGYIINLYYVGLEEIWKN